MGAKLHDCSARLDYGRWEILARVHTNGSRRCLSRFDIVSDETEIKFHGVVVDVSLPAPLIVDEGEKWDIITGEANVDDILEYDGLVNKTAPRFRKSGVTEMLAILEPEVPGEASGVCDGPDGPIAAYDPYAVIDQDIHEAEAIPEEPPP